jgi:glycosyltransferase involved in cell wall biosynthesis
MHKRMIFHHPLPVEENGKTGSQVRPFEMLKAFKEIGYEVFEVTGHWEQRVSKIRYVEEEVRAGKSFDFLYSESSSRPTLLTAFKHNSINSYKDFRWMNWLKKYSIPIGLYYRDIHWKFDVFHDYVPQWYKRPFFIGLYWYDWIIYHKLLDYLFIPSEKMKYVLPTRWPEDRLVILPPGCNLEDVSAQGGFSKDLRMLYVGGITPPTYDLTNMFKCVSAVKGFHLTICCREDEWAKVKDYYYPYNENVISIIHLYGNELKDVYYNHDVFLLIWNPNEYLEFAFPVKVLESIGYGLPIITNKGTEAARFIEKENVGWVIESSEKLEDFLITLQKRPELINQMRNQVIKARSKHSWTNRAMLVSDTLINNR